MVTTSSASLDVLVEHLERLDAGAVTGHVAGMMERGASLAEAAATVLYPAWAQIDQRAAAGDIDPAASGAAAAVARKALSALARVSGRDSLPPTFGPLAVVSPSSSPDLFCAELVAELAGAGGWSVDTLSGAASADELAAYARTCRPAAVAVTAHDPTDLPALAAVVAAAHRERVPVLAWGPAFGNDGCRSRRLGGDAWAPTLDVVTAVLEVWQERRPSPGPVVGLPAAYQDLERLRPSLLAAGVVGEDGEAADWARRAAPSLVSHLSAAVALGDASVLADHLERERQALRRSQLHDVHLVGLVDAIAAALPLTSEVAREFVFTSREELRRSLMGAARTPRPDRAPPAVPRPAPAPLPEPASEITAGGVSGNGQVFADLLLLAAQACQAPFAVLSVPQGPGVWRTLSYGFEQRVGLNDPRLFDLVVAQVEPVEVSDLAAHPELARSSFAGAPHNLRWAFAVALRNTNGSPLGVVAVLDRWLRDATRREHRVLQAVARQATDQLVQLRRAASVPAPWSPQAGGPMGGDPLAGLASVRRANPLPEGQQLLRSHEVAVLFDVTERTVINWAAAGKLPSLRTIGGHLRFRSEDVLELLAGRTSGARNARTP